jgi:glycosyltransferase involved in cell wall biosynthesis
MKDKNGGGLRECFVSTFPPRECGIATFTFDLRQALHSLRDNDSSTVIALTNTPDGYEYPPEVAFEVRQNQINDYRLAAEYINFSGIEVVCLQHEFGIFGGPEGSYVTEFLERLRKPVVTTLHTVLGNPQPAYREAMTQVASLSDYLVVLNSKAIPMLRDIYRIPEEKICLVHHGVPDVPFVDPNFYKDKFGVEGRLVILTFGLLNRNKGIELMLDALPPVIEAHPHVVYLVLGATHPEVKRRDGEEYRLWLLRRVRNLGLEDHVIFYDRYVAFSELLEFIGACDIYVTPYQSKEQIVSGTLAYAVGMGKAVVSTPYSYAEELLGDGRGKVVSMSDPRALTQTLLKLIERPATRHRMRKRAYEYGRQMIWTEVAKRYEEVFRRATELPQLHATARRTIKLASDVHEVPEIKLDHLIRLTDDTGIIQHATYGVPDRRFGYSTDDVGRALAVALMHYSQFEDERVVDLASRYLSFLAYAQLPDGYFHNFMSYDREFLDERGSEDTLGRALWGLGAAVAYSPREGMSALARDLFERAFNVLELEHPRAIAYALCGLYDFLQRYDGAAQVKRRLTEMANQLAGFYETSCSEDWHWFGDDLTYANARMPHAILLAYRATGDERFKRIGLESLDFLLDVTYRDGMFEFIGNQGWYRRGEERAFFSQQPIEAGYTAEACMTAYKVTRRRRYLDLARAAAEWLLGRNRLGGRLYDLTTGACADGLDPQGVSMNQGAESVICALLTLLVVAQPREKEIASETENVVVSSEAAAPNRFSAAAKADRSS